MIDSSLLPNINNYTHSAIGSVPVMVKYTRPVSERTILDIWLGLQPSHSSAVSFEDEELLPEDIHIYYHPDMPRYV